MLGLAEVAKWYRKQSDELRCELGGAPTALAHEYGFIDYRIVWRALSRDLPANVAAMPRILSPETEND